MLWKIIFEMILFHSWTRENSFCVDKTEKYCFLIKSSTPCNYPNKNNFVKSVILTPLWIIFEYLKNSEKYYQNNQILINLMVKTHAKIQ